MSPTPDGTITETDTKINAGVWDDGIVTDTYVQYGSTPTVVSHTHLDWELDSNSLNPRVHQIKTTNNPGAASHLTKATVLSYTTNYNNVSVVSERGFTTDEASVGDEVRRTETTYVTSSTYIARAHFHLPEDVKVFPGGSTTPISYVHYAYDGTSLTQRSGIIMHDGY